MPDMLVSMARGFVRLRDNDGINSSVPHQKAEHFFILGLAEVRDLCYSESAIANPTNTIVFRSNYRKLRRKTFIIVGG